MLDLPASLELLKGMEEERDHERFPRPHRPPAGQSTNPVEAQRVIRMMRDLWPFFRDAYTQRVCYRMVTVDPAGEEPGPGVHDQLPIQSTRPGGDGACPGQDREGSCRGRRRCGQAVRECSSRLPREDDQWDGLSMACTAAAGLRPILEQTRREPGAEHVWRTLAIVPVAWGDAATGFR